jgi:hypothetical protein
VLPRRPEETPIRNRKASGGRLPFDGSFMIAGFHNVPVTVSTPLVSSTAGFAGAATGCPGVLLLRCSTDGPSAAW